MKILPGRACVAVLVVAMSILGASCGSDSPGAAAGWSAVGAAGFTTDAVSSSSIAVSSSGTIYVGFVSSTSGKASVYAWDGSAWAAVGSSPLSSTGSIASIQLVIENTSGELFAALDISGGAAEVWRYTGGSWTNTNWTASANFQVASLLASNGYVYAAYNSGSNANVRRWGGGTTWSQYGAANFHSMANLSGYLKLAADSNGVLYAVMSGDNTGAATPFYVCSYSSAWAQVGATFSITQTTNTLFQLDLGLDGTVPYVYYEYYDASSNPLNYVYKYTSSAWSIVQNNGSNLMSTEQIQQPVFMTGGGRYFVAYKDISVMPHRGLLKGYDGTAWNVQGSPFAANDLDYLSGTLSGGVVYLSFADGNQSWKLSVSKYVP
jgi:hypothetical protein